MHFQNPSHSLYSNMLNRVVYKTFNRAKLPEFFETIFNIIIFLKLKYLNLNTMWGNMFYELAHFTVFHIELETHRRAIQQRVRG